VGYNTSKTLHKLTGRIVIEDKKGQMVNSTRENMWCIGGKKHMRNIVIFLMNFIFLI